MNKRTGQRIVVIALIISLISLGFIRDFVFVNINYAIGFLNGKAEAYWGHSSTAFLVDQGTDNLLMLKWVLTISFTVLFLFLSLFIIYTLHRNRNYLKWFVLLYSTIIGIAGCMYLAGWLFGLQTLGYTLAREFMGFVQSPFPLMLFLPAIYLVKSTGHKA